MRPANRDGRVRQNAVIYCQIRLVYCRSGVIAYVRFTRATNFSADDKGDPLSTLACLVNVYLKYAAKDLLHFIYSDRYVVKLLGEGRYSLSSNSVCMVKLVLFLSPIQY